MPEEEAAAVKPGHGGVVEYKGEKAGVFHDEQNLLHVVSTKCQHMGCQLACNPEERSWDCPCHGSRFDIDGEVISGPAVRPLDNHKGLRKQENNSIINLDKHLRISPEVWASDGPKISYPIHNMN